MSELIDKYFAGEMTCEEKKDLFDRIESDEALKKEFLRMQNVVALTQILSRQDDSETSRKGKQHFMQLLFRKRLKRAITVSLKYAAVFAVLVVGTFYTAKLYLSEEFGKSYTIVTAPKGQRVKIELPDGTIAWLSPCSRLRFAASFNETDRKIELDGATYFDVAKNPEKPFVVSAKGYRIRVLGTKFNISAYKNSKEFETDLVEGCVHSSRCHGMMQWQRASMNSLSVETPFSCRPSISPRTAFGLTTTPGPMTLTHSGYRMPDGISCSLYFSPPATTV